MPSLAFFLAFYCLWGIGHAQSCNITQDCSNNGVCVNQKCLCNKFWLGSTCSIAFEPALYSLKFNSLYKNNVLVHTIPSIYSTVPGLITMDHSKDSQTNELNGKIYLIVADASNNYLIYTYNIGTNGTSVSGSIGNEEIFSIEFDLANNILYLLRPSGLKQFVPPSSLNHIVNITGVFPVFGVSAFDSRNSIYYFNGYYENSFNTYQLRVNSAPPLTALQNHRVTTIEHDGYTLFEVVYDSDNEAFRIFANSSSYYKYHESSSSFSISTIDYSNSFISQVFNETDEKVLVKITNGILASVSNRTDNLFGIVYSADVACDGTPYSSTNWDNCGICNGNNASVCPTPPLTTIQTEPAETSPTDLSLIIYGSAGGGGLILLIFCAVCFFCCLKKCRNKSQERRFHDHEEVELYNRNQKKDPIYSGIPSSRVGSANPPKKKSLQVKSEWWRIDYDELEFEKKIGSGGFGVVYKGTWRDQEVAIKQMHKEDMNEQQIEEFRREAALMVTMKSNPNVVKLYGVCIDDDRPMAIVTEYLELGSLKDILDSGKHKISLEMMLKLAKDIAKGMQHLHHEKIYHRDLSARNILIGENKNGWVAKVSDFGLSRLSEGKEATTKSDTGPLKWMAPEALLHRKYSAKTDVWSFGVTMWEILTLGKEPYPEMDNVVAASAVMHKGLRLVPPENTPVKLAALLKRCWETDPDDRPTFHDIIDQLEQIEEDVKENPFYSTSQYNQ